MSNEFVGYKIERNWRKLVLFRFNAKTHARMAVDEVRPFNCKSKEEKREVILARLKSEGIPLPPPCFEPK